MENFKYRLELPLGMDNKKALRVFFQKNPDVTDNQKQIVLGIANSDLLYHIKNDMPSGDGYKGGRLYLRGVLNKHNIPIESNPLSDTPEGCEEGLMSALDGGTPITTHDLSRYQDKYVFFIGIPGEDVRVTAYLPD